MGKYVGLTGTPGTGKRTLAPLLASRMGLPCVSLHDLELSSGLVKQGGKAAEVDTDALGRFLVEHVPGPALVHGHLLPYVLGRRQLKKLAVLRCEPMTLKQRLLSRGYRPEKVRANVEAELIGVLSAYSFSLFGKGKTAEFDTTRAGLTTTVAAVSGFLRGGAEPTTRIEWTFRYSSASTLQSLLS